MLEALADGVVTDTDTVQRYLHNAQGEIQHLSHLIDDLFELAQLDAGHASLQLQQAFWRDLISDTLESMQAQAERRKITLSGQVDSQVDVVLMAPEKIQRVLDNLVGNALRHTPPGGEVKAGRRYPLATTSALRLPTAAKGSRPKTAAVFDSFFRGENARARDDQGLRGVGLGLAIVQRSSRSARRRIG